MTNILPDLRRSRGEPGIKVGAGIGQPTMLEQVQPGVILMSCISDSQMLNASKSPLR